MVQRRAARFVCNNYNQQASVTEMINELGWDLLEHRRTVLRLALMKQIGLTFHDTLNTNTPGCDKVPH